MIPSSICRKEAERACSRCGMFFCHDHLCEARCCKVHGSRRYVAVLFDRQYFCDLCRPNQTLVIAIVTLFSTMNIVGILVVLYLLLRFSS